LNQDYIEIEGNGQENSIHVVAPVFKIQFFSLVTVIQILAIFLSGCGMIASKYEDNAQVLKGTTGDPTPMASPELIRKVSVTQIPQIEQTLSGTVTVWAFLD